MTQKTISVHNIPNGVEWLKTLENDMVVLDVS